MFTKKKISNFKLVRVIVFALIIITGGLMYTHSASAFSVNVPPGTNLYSISETRVNLNNSDTTTSIVLIGCLPQSGDKYDMNTGKPCNYSNVKSEVLFGCTPRSGDKYDMNTGKPCIYDDKTIFLVACAPRTNDIYNIYSGIPCSKNYLPRDKNSGINSVNKVQELSTGSTNNKLSKNINPSTISTEQVSNPSETASGIDQKLSGREILKNAMAASVAKLGDITKGPMFGWLILLILVIIIGGSYGIYSFNFFKKNDNEDEIKDEIKNTVTPTATNVGTNNATTVSQPVHTTPSTQGTMPLTTPNTVAHSVNNTSQSQTIH
ncbi:MAG: hypothetical protein WCI91_03020 [Candidatus Nomurabacteria bacterium]